MVELNATVQDSCTNANAVTLRTYHNGNTDRNSIDRSRSDILYYAPTKITEVDIHQYRSTSSGYIRMGNVIRRTISTINPLTTTI